MTAHVQLRLIMTTADTELLGLIVSGSTMLWGLWLFNPHVNTFDTSASYRMFRQIGELLQALGSPMDPEAFWGLLISVFGGLHFWGTMTGSLFLRRWGAFSTALLRASMFVFTGLSSNWTNGGLPDFFCWAVASGWIYWRLSGSYRVPR